MAAKMVPVATGMQAASFELGALEREHFPDLPGHAIWAGPDPATEYVPAVVELSRRRLLSWLTLKAGLPALTPTPCIHNY